MDVRTAQKYIYLLANSDSKLYMLCVVVINLTRLADALMSLVLTF